MAQVNQRISEYVLEEKVGGGTFGEVWRAHHHVWADQLVAIKLPTDSNYVRNLQREGAAVHGLVHHNIVRAIGFDPYGDPPYLVMEFVPGTSLRPLIQQRRLPVEDTIAVLRQVAGGLAYAHAHGVIHRDIKPENILIHERALGDGFGTEGVVKVTDFGLGRAAATTAGSIVYSTQGSDPESWEIAGTLDYMAPEARSGDVADTRVDIYACGVMLYELLTGERPAGTDLPSELNPAIPKYLDEVFRRSYARLDKRFATAEEFARALIPPLAMPPTLLGLDKSGRPPVLPLRVAGGPMAPPGLAVHRRTHCHQCQQAVQATDQFCMHCGMQLVERVRRCHKCGAYPDPADSYCMFCGESLQEAAAV